MVEQTGHRFPGVGGIKEDRLSAGEEQDRRIAFAGRHSVGLAVVLIQVSEVAGRYPHTAPDEFRCLVRDVDDAFLLLGGEVAILNSDRASGDAECLDAKRDSSLGTARSVCEVDTARLDAEVRKLLPELNGHRQISG